MSSVDIGIITHLLKKVFGEKFITKEIILGMQSGIISISKLHELYEAKIANTKVVGGKGQDLENGDECKFRTLYTVYKNGLPYLTASLSARDTKVKTGNIILALYNPLTNTLDRLRVPKARSIKHGYIPGKHLGINFSTKGKGYGKLQKFLISSEIL